MHIVECSTGAAAVARQWKLNSPSQKHPWQLRWKPVCASTEIVLSDWLLAKPMGSSPRAFLAARQTRGVGQRGRTWHAPIGGVWLSAAFKMNLIAESAGLLGLGVAVALAESLERKFIPVQIKWPNDLIVDGRKLAGLLPKLVHRGSILRYGRIGIGLNVANKVPRGAIALNEILKPASCKTVFWASEVLLALDRGLELSSRADSVCEAAQRRLWSDHVKDPKTGKTWQIERLGLDGSLHLRRGSWKTAWTRWG